MKTNKTRLPNLIILLILTSITIVFWVVFSIYSAVSKPPNIELPNELLEDVNPKLDSETVNQIKSRNYYEE